MPENTLTPAQKFLRHPGRFINLETDNGYEPCISIKDMEEYIRLLKEEWKKNVSKAIDNQLAASSGYHPLMAEKRLIEAIKNIEL